ncbi:MAG: NADH-quinone oxidoreductase subunit NuoK [Thermodesulfobacteriota bacterium]
MISLHYYLILGAVLFSIGAVGVFTQKNALIIYMCIELMLNSVNLTFIAFSSFLNDMNGHVFVFMIMTVAAAEAAVGLAIIISLFRNKSTVNVDEINLMKG